jgi:HlyD family secretion protein
MPKFTRENIGAFIMRKRIMIPLGLVVIYFVVSVVRGNTNTNVSIITPTAGDLSATVRATGQVTSKTDLTLSFTKSGTVRSVKVAVGDKARAGDILASIGGAAENASVTSARGALAASQAKLKRTQEGATNEEINLAKVALANAQSDYENAKVSQQSLVDTAHSLLLNSTPEAVPEGASNEYTAPTVSGSFSLGTEGTIRITTYYSGTPTFNASGLVSATGIVSSTAAQPIGNSGLYIKFPSTTSSNITTWVIELPNKKASTYTANYNAYMQAQKTQTQVVSSAKSLVDVRTAELAVKQAAARTSDIALAEADVLSAQGGLEQALARYEDTIIRAPSNGTITRVDVKYGEPTDPQKVAIVLQDVDNLYVEADINESNITKVVLGQHVAITLDAFNSNASIVNPTGTIMHIDPSSVTKDGVVNFKIKVSIDQKIPEIRPGMNAEILINEWTHANVLAIPKAAITTLDSSSPFVYIITNEKRKSYTKRPITLSGFVGDGNLAEVVSGLSSTEKVALISK